MTDYDYRPYDAERDAAATNRVLWQAFTGTQETATRWLAQVGDHSHVLTVDGEVQAVLSGYAFGHWFGGRRVSALGIAGVAVERTARGHGVGTRIMQAVVRDAHARGIALSSLFPAVQPLYRRVGYERAGHTYVVQAHLDKLAPLDRTLPIRPGTNDDEPTLEALERRRASIHDGNIDRDVVMWQNARTPRAKPADTYVVEEGGSPTGYLRMRYVDGAKGTFLSVSELVATTPRAAGRLVAFLGDHAAQVATARWLGHPTEAVQTVATDQRAFEAKVGDVWMLRITHLANALAERGYPAGLTTELHLDVTDDLIPENAGAWLVRIDDGGATVERGGEARIRVHVRDLAPLYSGYQSPFLARASRSIEASDEDLARVAAAFAGRAPWMQDSF